MIRFTTKLLPSRSGNLGVMQLNNPKPLHALTLDMSHCLQDVLSEWYADETVAAVLLKSSSEAKVPAFCSGGDVKSVYMAGIEGGDGGNGNKHGQGVPDLPTAEFFRQEYLVNYALATASKPQISLWDGIVMGGGVGLSIHGKYRVATENTVFAMPETGIGLFPDVGSMYWMPKMLSEGVAVYLALTGARLKAPDLLYTGLATHYISSKRLEELEDALVLASHDFKPASITNNVVAPVLMSFHEFPLDDPRESMLAKQRQVIDQVFGVLSDPQRGGVEDIVDSLQKLDTDFGRETLANLDKMSPTSLKITLEGLRRGSKLHTVGEDLQMEFRMSQSCMRPGSDFYEGIRAVLVDKDHAPVWNPASLKDVTDEMVESYFAPIEHEWEIPKVAVPSKL
jgi:enoyl-CoA hydratase/carnithine racemase